MTIRLLAQYQGNPPNTIVTLAGGVETALVAAGNATTDLSGGVPPVYVTPANSQIGDVLYGPDGVPLGIADPTGKLLTNFNGITVPGAPTGVALTPIAGGVLAAFTPSATLGGTVGVGYEVTLSNGRVQRGAASPIVVNSPAGAVTGTVKQINGAGLSVASAASASATVTTYTAPTIPGAPTSLVLTAGNGKVTANWTAAASNGSAIRNTVVTLSNGATATALGSATTVDVITPNDLPVTATARANNGEGAGPVSAVSNSVTPVTAPNAYQRFKNSLASVAAGTGYSRAGLLGDSTVAGARALGPAANAVRTESPVVYLKTQFNLVQGLPTIASSWIGDQSFGMTNGLTNFAYDTRLSQPDGVGYAFTNPSPRTVAGSMMFNSTNANRMGFLPEVPCDTFDIYYPTNTTLGTFNATRTGSTLVPVSQVGSSGMAKLTFTGPLNGADPVYVARASAGTYIIGIDAYNSTVKSIRLFGMGWSGGKVADWISNTTGFDPLPALIALHLDLVLIRPGINDAVAGTAPATFKTQLATLVDALIADGTNVALATHYPSNIASAPQSTQNAIAQQVRDVAAERGLSVRDTYAEWGTWVAANALGYMSDNLHPNKSGYEAEAASSATFILGLAA